MNMNMNMNVFVYVSVDIRIVRIHKYSTYAIAIADPPYPNITSLAPLETPTVLDPDCLLVIADC